MKLVDKDEALSSNKGSLPLPREELKESCHGGCKERESSYPRTILRSLLTFFPRVETTDSLFGGGMINFVSEMDGQQQRRIGAGEAFKIDHWHTLARGFLRISIDGQKNDAPILLKVCTFVLFEC